MRILSFFTNLLHFLPPEASHNVALLSLKFIHRIGILRFLTTWCLAVSTFFSGFLAFYFIKMWIVSIQLGERSQGADEILLWIPQTGVAIGSLIFFICITHNFLKLFIINKND